MSSAPSLSEESGPLLYNYAESGFLFLFISLGQRVEKKKEGRGVDTKLTVGRGLA